MTPERPTDDSIFDAGAGRSRRRRDLRRAMPEVPRQRWSSENVTKDTIFDENKEPVFSGDPETVRRRIRHGISARWTKVLVGETEQMVSIVEYLNGEKHKKVVKVLEEYAAKRNQKMYERRPDLFDKETERTARKLYEIINED